MPGFVYSCISNVQERYKEELRHCSFSQGAYSLLGCLRFMPKSLKKKKRLKVVSVLREVV